MIDEDDDIPSFVGSGSPHHVSVSEHTGNAKTPHNKVVSHEEETLARKLAFEKHKADSDSVKTPDAKDAAANVQTVQPDEMAANVQKIAADAAPANRQALTPNARPGANVQDIPTEVIAPNLQGIHTDTLGANRASMASPEQSNDNRQTVHADAAADDNRQKVNAPTLAANVQGVTHDAVQSHQEALPSDDASDNRQTLAADAATPDNRQKIGDPVKSANRQALDSEVASDNRQALPGSKAGDRASSGASPSGVNAQQIPTLNEIANLQPVQEQGLSDNRQALEQPNAQTHREALGSQAERANRQAAPQAPEPGANHQPVGVESTQDHREVISTAPIERAKVDFSKAASSRVQTSHAPGIVQGTQAAKAKKKPRPGVTLPGLISDPSTASPEVLDAAAEFHRRVLDIKHNVDDLNHRLTDFEQKHP